MSFWKSLGNGLKKVGGGLLGGSMMGFGTALGLGGDILGAWSSHEQQEDNLRAQRDFAQHGIRWRVADAQAAGVSPIFALGASTQPYSPNPVVPAGLENTTNAVNNATLREREQRAMALEEKRVNSEVTRNEAEAMLALSQAAKNRQGMASVSPFPETYTSQLDYKNAQVEGILPEDKNQVFNPHSDAIIRRLDPEYARTFPEITGVHVDELDWSVSNVGGGGMHGEQPLWTRYLTEFGPIDLPYNPENQSLMEALEGLDVKYLPMVLARNSRRFGKVGRDRLAMLYDPGLFNPGPPIKGHDEASTWGEHYVAP